MSGGLSSELANQTSYFERGGRKVRPHVDDRAVALARLKPRRALSAWLLQTIYLSTDKVHLRASLVWAVRASRPATYVCGSREVASTKVRRLSHPAKAHRQVSELCFLKQGYCHVFQGREFACKLSVLCKYRIRPHRRTGFLLQKGAAWPFILRTSRHALASRRRSPCLSPSMPAAISALFDDFESREVANWRGGVVVLIYCSPPPSQQYTAINPRCYRKCGYMTSTELLQNRRMTNVIRVANITSIVRQPPSWRRLAIIFSI
eukprot:1058454-Prorocentrum_minimum.AAC.3